MRKTIMFGAAARAAAIGWHFVRPELLFIDKIVNESLTLSTPDTVSRACFAFVNRIADGPGVELEAT